MAGNYPVPDGLAWDLSSGRAEGRVSPRLSPVQLARLGRLGQGAIGDMGAHLMDHSFWALDLGYPTSIETVATPFNRPRYPYATTTITSSRRAAASRPVKLRGTTAACCRRSRKSSARSVLNPRGGALLVGRRAS